MKYALTSTVLGICCFACSKTQEVVDPELLKAPHVFAGGHLLVRLPDDSLLLQGYASTVNGAANTFEWKQMEGTTQAVIDNPLAQTTYVRKLVRGNYVFRFAATNKMNISGRDLLTVTVLDQNAGINERIFKGPSWSCPWHCSVLLKDFHPTIPQNVSFRLLIRFDDATHWSEVFRMQGDTNANNAYYTVNGNDLAMYTNGKSRNFDLKVVY